jgi:predicted Zn finger-like uncharacterized protein
VFTSCSNCQRQYRIHAEQLAAARGLVRCGYCGTQFNALERLTDKPVPIAVLQVRPVEQQVENHAPYVEAESIPEDEPQFDIPEILQDKQQEPASTWSRVFWVSATVIMILVMVTQVSWFHRDELLRRYPEIKPWAQELCDRFQCELIRQYKTSDIKLLNRDVRLHPNYADTLLVNATMANRSDKIQPYPRIQFSLFNTNGAMIASRKFNPEEYLDNSIDVKNGMPANQPVHFVLEVTGSTDNAVSFEFRFL